MASAEWDTSKENFAPIKSGRKAAALCEQPALTTPAGKGMSEELEAKKK